MKKALKNILCPSCGGAPCQDDREHLMQKMQHENSRLKEEVSELV